MLVQGTFVADSHHDRTCEKKCQFGDKNQQASQSVQSRPARGRAIRHLMSEGSYCVGGTRKVCFSPAVGTIVDICPFRSAIIFRQCNGSSDDCRNGNKTNFYWPLLYMCTCNVHTPTHTLACTTFTGKMISRNGRILRDIVDETKVVNIRLVGDDEKHWHCE